MTCASGPSAIAAALHRINQIQAVAKSFPIRSEGLIPMSRVYSKLTGLVCLVLIEVIAGTGEARAQQQPPLMPPNVSLRDENGVDLMSGMVSFSIPTLSIGNGEFKIVRTYEYEEKPTIVTTILPDSLRAGVFFSGPANIAQVGQSKERVKFDGVNWFTYSGGKVVYPGNGTAIYTQSDGTEVTIDVTGSSDALTGPATKIVWPNGKIWTYSYQVSGQEGAKTYSLTSIKQNNGLQIRYQGSTVLALNQTVEYCNPTSTTCSLALSWPTASANLGGGGGTDTFTDAAGQTTVMVRNFDNVTVDARLPQSGGGSTITYDRCNTSFLGPYKCYWATGSGWVGGTQVYPLYDRVISETRGSTTWGFQYNWNIACCYAQYQRSGPNGAKTVFYYARDYDSWPIWIDYDDGRYNFSQNEASRVTSHVWKEGNEEQFTYDTRGNVTQILYKAKPGSGLPDQTATGNYDAVCSNMKTCNQPNWVIDRKGNRTDYQYSAIHGQVTRVIGPAVDGVQPVTRYYYTQRFAWYFGSSGTYVRDPDGIWLLTSTKTCKSGATVGDACAIANDEVIELYDYGPDSGPNNLWLRGEGTQADGQTFWSCFGYDRLGNRISVTKPNAGLASCS